MSIRALVSAGALITLGMLAGRLLGLLREMLLASHFGVGSGADLAIMLLLIPDFITGALIGTAASAALVPAFAAREHVPALELFWQALLTGVLVFVLIALCIFAAEAYWHAVLPASASAVPQASLAFFLTLCSLPLTAASAVVTAYLQYRERFLVPAFASAIFNSIIILVLWLLPTGLRLLACGIIGAAVVRLLAQVAAFSRAGRPIPKPSWLPWHLGRPLLGAYGATAGSGVFGLLPQYLPYAIVATVGGSVALFNYSFKLSIMPPMLAQTVVQMVLLPWLVRLRKTASEEALRQTYTVALQLAWAVSLAACLALSLASADVAALCFGYGKMTPDHIAEVGQLFAIGLWALPGMITTGIWQQIFYSGGHTRAPLHASAVQALLVAPLCWLGYALLGLPGVLAAYAVLQCLPVVLLVRQGYSYGMIQRCLPSRAYAQMTLATLAVFLPLAALFIHIPMPAWAGVMVAALIGVAVLTAGMAACQPVRRWAWQKIGSAA